MEEKLRGELPGQKPKGMRWYQYIWLLVGLAFAKTVPEFFGLGLLTPVLYAYLIAFVIIFAISKLMKGFAKPMMWALVMQSGHLIWFIAGVIIMTMGGNSHLLLSLPDIILCTGGLIWLLFKPRLIPVIFLTIYNGISIFGNVNIYNHSTLSSQKGLILHITLNILTILYLIIGLIEIHRDKGSCKITMNADKDKELKKEKGLCPRCGANNSPDAFRCRNENCSEILPQYD